MNSTTPCYDVVIGVNYYAPYVSGLTEVARIEAEGLAKRGHSVAVVASQHDPRLPRWENRHGVDVYRCPVRWRHGRGVLAPSFVPTLAKLSRRASSVHLHAPMLEAGAASALCGFSTRVVTTHHIDIWVPRTLTSPLATFAVNASFALAARTSDTLVVNSFDQAEGSKFRKVLSRRHTEAVPAPCLARSGGSPRYRDSDGPHYGFLGRIVADKGLDRLIRAFSEIGDPDARLLIGGEDKAVAGGGVMSELRAAIEADPRIHVLGMLRGHELDDFYASIDVFTLPSVAESFGIVQAEAIMLGIPSITSDIRGGRYPVLATGLGRLVPPGDHEALVEAMRTLPSHFDDKVRQSSARVARQMFGAETFLDAHEELLLGAQPMIPATA